MRRLDGISALITGASSGIGRGLARVFLDEGAQVFLTARGEDRLRETAGELEAAHPGRTGYAASDVGDPDSAGAMTRAALARFPDLSVLVNNASILGVRAPIIEQDPEVWEDTLRINTASLLYVTKPLLPAFLERETASIINVSSTVGRIGKPNWGPYAVSKFGLEGFTQTLGAELGGHRGPGEQRQSGSDPHPDAGRRLSGGGSPHAADPGGHRRGLRLPRLPGIGGSHGTGAERPRLPPVVVPAR